MFVLVRAGYDFISPGGNLQSVVVTHICSRNVTWRCIAGLRLEKFKEKPAVWKGEKLRFIRPSWIILPPPRVESRRGLMNFGNTRHRLKTMCENGGDEDVLICVCKSLAERNTAGVSTFRRCGNTTLQAQCVTAFCDNLPTFIELTVVTKSTHLTLPSTCRYFAGFNVATCVGVQSPPLPLETRRVPSGTRSGGGTLSC